MMARGRDQGPGIVNGSGRVQEPRMVQVPGRMHNPRMVKKSVSGRGQLDRSLGEGKSLGGCAIIEG